MTFLAETLGNASLTFSPQLHPRDFYEAKAVEGLLRLTRFVSTQVLDAIEISNDEIFQYFKEDSAMSWEACVVGDYLMAWSNQGVYVRTWYTASKKGGERYVCIPHVTGIPQKVREVSDSLLRRFTGKQLSVKWVYGEKFSTYETPLRQESVVDEMFPYIEGRERFYSEYLQSRSSILLLIGPPGTGKTSFINGLLRYGNLDSFVSYDPTVLSKDDFFVNFISGKRGALILEDADDLLLPRVNGNGVMHRFLSVGDGLIELNRKKLIFSTNLESIDHIDSALTRKGRCFDVVHFRALDYEESVTLCDKMGLPYPEDRHKHYTLGELFNPEEGGTSAVKKNRVGFL